MSIVIACSDDLDLILDLVPSLNVGQLLALNNSERSYFFTKAAVAILNDCFLQRLVS